MSADKTRLFPIPTDISDRYDIVILFCAVEVHTIGYSTLYFVAEIDHQISFTSSILPYTSTIKWNNEQWTVRNVPSNAKLSISIYGKDDRKFVNNCIGEFEIADLTTYRAPRDGHAIVGTKGRFHLLIQVTKSSDESQELPRYTFDGPCRYFRYDSLDTDPVLSTWKIQLRRISAFFPSDERQQWNEQYQPSREASKDRLFSLAALSITKPAQQVLYERSLKQNENGRLSNTDDLWKLIFFDRTIQRMRPRVYNYIIDDNTWQFSETTHQFFIEPEIKHARLANYSECVRYAGEFHLRPKFGWNRLDDEEWELVFDNTSGTYSPNADLLVNLKNLLLFNFPGLDVTTYDYKDPVLRESIEQLGFATKRYKLNNAAAMSKRISSRLSST